MLPVRNGIVQINSRFVLLVSLLFAGSMWFYVQRVLIPHQQSDAQLHRRPRGNLSDLYPRWLGTRELLLHHRNPYSPEVTREIQSGYYGRPIDSTRPDDPKDEQRFAYPLYVVFFLAPTIFFSFALVKVIFGWLLLIFTCASVFLWLKFLQWKPPTTTIVILLLLTLGSYPSFQGMKLQQLTLLVCVLISGSAVLILRGQLLLAGVLLASATIKPQIVVLLIPWLLIWSISEWRTRKLFVIGFSLTLLALLIGAQLVLPGWIGQFREALAAYRRYAGEGGSVLEILISPGPGKLLAGMLVVALAVLAWKTRHVGADSLQFSYTWALVLAVTVAIIPMTALYNHLSFLPAIFIVARQHNFFSGKHFLPLVVSFICSLLIFWPWIATCALLLASCVLPPATVQSSWALPLYTSLAIPPAVVILLVPNVLIAFRQSGVRS